MKQQQEHVRFEKLKIVNFKGIKNFSMTFNTNGANYIDSKANKTSIIDAIQWLLFGKDSKGAKKFQFIRNNTNLCTVELTVLKGTERITIKKSHDGDRNIIEGGWKQHEALVTYISNTRTIEEAELVMNSLINPYYFNEDIDWRDRRTIVFDMALVMKEKDYINKVKDSEFKNDTLKHENLVAMRKKHESRSRALKKELKELELRIQQLHDVIPLIVDDTTLKSIEKEFVKLKELINEKRLEDTFNKNRIFLIKSIHRDMAVDFSNGRHPLHYFEVIRPSNNGESCVVRLEDIYINNMNRDEKLKIGLRTIYYLQRYYNITFPLIIDDVDRTSYQPKNTIQTIMTRMPKVERERLV